jgi:hypothetical protein
MPARRSWSPSGCSPGRSASRDAYELHLLPTIDIYTKTRLNRAQCETFLDEIVFVGMVSNDDLLREHLGHVQGVAAACVAVPQRELIIEGP